MRPVFLLCTLTCSQLVVAAPLPVFGALSKLKNELFKNHRNPRYPQNPYSTPQQPSPSESAHQTSTVESYSAAPKVTSNEPDLPIVEPYDPDGYNPRMQTSLERKFDELHTRKEEMEEYMEIISADVFNYFSLLSYQQNKINHKHSVDGFSQLRKRMQLIQKSIRWLEKQIKKTEDKIQHEKIQDLLNRKLEDATRFMIHIRLKSKRKVNQDPFLNFLVNLNFQNSALKSKSYHFLKFGGALNFPKSSSASENDHL
ncbi:hypothetical protein MT418_003879 [Batrachochytrium dendrobatidis]